MPLALCLQVRDFIACKSEGGGLDPPFFLSFLGCPSFFPQDKKLRKWAKEGQPSTFGYMDPMGAHPECTPNEHEIHPECTHGCTPCSAT